MKGACGIAERCDGREFEGNTYEIEHLVHIFRGEDRSIILDKEEAVGGGGIEDLLGDIGRRA